MSGKTEVSKVGVYCAIALCFVSMIGQEFTTNRLIDSYNWIWLSIYGLALLVLSGASVNFKPDRWLR